jgi:serine-type D-Ala-D-Ala carboxypeptidase (penicillin-binding protein 5/6)
MKMLLLVLIVLIESLGFRISFFDGSDFFNLTENPSQKIKLKEVALDQIPSFPSKIRGVSDIDIGQKVYLVVDLDSQKILAKKAINQRKPIASLTKIMTAMVVLESMDLEETISVPKEIAKVTGSKLYLLPDTKITVRELLKGMLIKSANDCAFALEKGYDRKTAKGKFVELMNRKAEALAMTKTEFVEATGLSERNISTARDLSFLVNYALRKDLFRQIIKIYSTNIKTENGYQFPVTSTNRLLKTDQTVFGIKTGYLEEAGQCFIGGFEQNDRRLITVLLGSNNHYSRFIETKALADWAYGSYRW